MRRLEKWAPWLYWIVMLGGVVAYLAYALADNEAEVYLIGDLTHGHHQIGLSCASCHTAPFGGGEVLQNACVDCHGEELRLAKDSHPRSKFTDPRNADRVEILDARVCITCHAEHHPERARAMGVTLPDDLCIHCHRDIGDDRISHRGLDFASCATGGCHNYHDNSALYEDFLLAHQAEADLLPLARVAESEIGGLMAVLLEHPLAPLSSGDADMPASVAVDAGVMHAWTSTAHARAGVNCMACHAETGTADAQQVWRQRPDPGVCAQCHAAETDGFRSGKHGMRLEAGLPPMRPELARIAMHDTAQDKELSCLSCHGAHDFDVRRAAVESCMDCHDDAHTRNYPQSPHARLWRAELDGSAPAGSGVSCATCHLPRSARHIDGVEAVLAEHNQNLNLRPNEKMLRGVCMNCHGLAFAIDALADAGLVERNFDGRPSAHVPSIDWAVLRHAERGDEQSDQTTHPEGDHP
jgi:hypothetical protein